MQSEKPPIASNCLNSNRVDKYYPKQELYLLF